MITKKELAKLLHLSVATIDRLMTQGMPKMKIGKAVRFDYGEVTEWLRERNENK